MTGASMAAMACRPCPSTICSCLSASLGLALRMARLMPCSMQPQSQRWRPATRACAGARQHVLLMQRHHARMPAVVWHDPVFLGICSGNACRAVVTGLPHNQPPPARFAEGFTRCSPEAVCAAARTHGPTSCCRGDRPLRRCLHSLTFSSSPPSMVRLRSHRRSSSRRSRRSSKSWRARSWTWRCCAHWRMHLQWGPMSSCQAIRVRLAQATGQLAVSGSVMVSPGLLTLLRWAAAAPCEGSCHICTWWPLQQVALAALHPVKDVFVAIP